MHSGGNGSAIYLSGANVDRMMIAEKHAVLGEAIKHRRELGRDKIRPHPIPNDDNDVFGHAFGCGWVTANDQEPRKNKGSESAERRKGSHVPEKMQEERGNA